MTATRHIKFLCQGGNLLKEISNVCEHSQLIADLLRDFDGCKYSLDLRSFPLHSLESFLDVCDGRPCTHSDAPTFRLAHYLRSETFKKSLLERALGLNREALRSTFHITEEWSPEVVSVLRYSSRWLPAWLKALSIKKRANGVAEELGKSANVIEEWGESIKSLTPTQLRSLYTLGPEMLAFCHKESPQQRLCSLFPGDGKAFFDFIQNDPNLVVAGGGVVYATNDQIERSIVGDVDIFVLNKDTEAIKRIFTFVENAFKQRDVRVALKTSLLELFFHNHNHSVQIILTDAPDPTALVERFDVDYVMCGFHRGKLFATERAIRAHLSGNICYLDEFTSFKRLQKAIQKGFSIPHGDCLHPDHRTNNQIIDTWKEGLPLQKTLEEMRPMGKPLTYRDVSFENNTHYSNHVEVIQDRLILVIHGKHEPLQPVCITHNNLAKLALTSVREESCRLWFKLQHIHEGQQFVWSSQFLSSHRVSVFTSPQLRGKKNIEESAGKWCFCRVSVEWVTRENSSLDVTIQKVLKCANEQELPANHEPSIWVLDSKSCNHLLIPRPLPVLLKYIDTHQRGAV